MSSPSHKHRIAWLDRFRAPSVEDLLAPFNKQISTVLEHARDRILSAEGTKEEISWQGVWRWTLVYRVPSDHDREWAYLVLDPAKPRLAVPIADELISDLPLKKFSKTLRDGLVHAPIVDAVRWAQWEVTSKTQVDEVLTLAELRLGLAKAGR